MEKASAPIAQHRSIGEKVVMLILISTLLIVLTIGFVRYFQGKGTGSGKLSVTASIYPLAYFAQTIGGDRVSVTTITPFGAEPHDYDPSPNDIVAIEQSKLLILNGGNLEAWGGKIRSTLSQSPVTVLSVGDGLATKQSTENGAVGTDPHIWLDPVLAVEEAQKIAQALIAADSANSAYYQQNEEQLISSLTALNTQYRQGLSACQKKDFVTSHAAFAYLASRYGLNQIAISGLSPDEEPSTKDLASVAAFVRDNNVNYIFFESLVSPKLADTIAQETGAKTLELNPIEGLTQQQLEQNQTYSTIMQSNLRNLQIALDCPLPL